MRKRIALAIFACFLGLASTYAQTSDFFDVVKTGTPRNVQDALIRGSDMNI